MPDPVQLVLQLMAIPGPSGQEGAVAKFVVDHLRKAGLPADAIRFDRANRRTPVASQTGNIVVRLPGTIRRPRRLLMAHMDTVPLCVGCRPEIHDGLVRPADPTTALGGDDRSGVAVVLNTAMEIASKKLPHPPLTFLWTIQEEIGLNGARYADLAMLGSPKLAFNWDGGSVDRLTIGATGGYRMTIDITGLAAHAGIAPQMGISAIAIAGLAIADLQRDGWHGDVRKGKNRGTSNIGVVEGGAATNVVTNHVRLQAEARSHDPAFRERIIRAFETAFRRAAKEVRNAEGKRGEAKIDGRLDYEAYKLPDDDPSVAAAEEAVRSLGGEPVRMVGNGGLDANWMTARGIPTVTLGCGQMNVHTPAERLDLKAFQSACQVALHLATAIDA